jgi:putative transposase
MPRPPRVPDYGGYAHITSHAVSGEVLFRTERDAGAYLKLLGVAVVKYELELCCYCLLSTHVHLLVRDRAARISPAMRDIGGGFTRAHNLRHQRRGPLFDRRFHRTLIRYNEHLLACVRYIVRNPVDAGLCARPQEWRWSSHRAAIGAVSAPSYLAAGSVIEMAGSRNAYLRLVEG